jgi:hypothetical protein
VYTSVPGFTPFYGTSAAAPDVAGIIALMQQVNPNLTPQQAADILAQSALPLSGEPDFLQGAGLVQADSAIALEEQVACYCLGTRILTDRGEVEVEDLSIGDHVVTRNNGLQPIRWIGRRSYKGRFLIANRDLMPICFRQGSIADHVPRRDLWVSQHHAMYIDGVLIEAKDLRNEVSIYQADGAEQVDYFHVELEKHMVSKSCCHRGSRSLPEWSKSAVLWTAPRWHAHLLLVAMRRTRAPRSMLVRQQALDIDFFTKPCAPGDRGSATLNRARLTDRVTHPLRARHCAIR